MKLSRFVNIKTNKIKGVNNFLILEKQKFNGKPKQHAGTRRSGTV